MSEAKEIVRRLRLTITLPELATDDFHLLDPIFQCYNQTRNPFALNDKQSELVLTIYDKYFTS